MPVIWLPRAVTDLEALVAFIGADNPPSAQRVLDAVFVQVRKLSDFQALGRPGRVSGTRELVVPHVHYLVSTRCSMMPSVYCACSIHRNAGPTTSEHSIETKRGAEPPFMWITHDNAFYHVLHCTV